MSLSHFYVLRKIVFYYSYHVLVHVHYLLKWTTWTRDVFNALPIRVLQEELSWKAFLQTLWFYIYTFFFISFYIFIFICLYLFCPPVSGALNYSFYLSFWVKACQKILESLGCAIMFPFSCFYFQFYIFFF